MRLQSFRSLAPVSASVLMLTLALAGTRASERPQYGGTLRAQLGGSVASLDPTVRATNSAEFDAKEDLSNLTFETLVSTDVNGEVRPALATSWEHDSASLHWTFHLRHGVLFHDGATLTPPSAASAIANPDKSWRIAASADAVAIDTASPTPDLPYLLAESRHALVRHGENGSLIGTGPFRLATWEAKKHATFDANLNYWAGRPFLDTVDVQLGVAARDRTIALQLVKADLIDLLPDSVRRAADDKLRITVTAPVELLALVFDSERPSAHDARLREAVARTIDRDAIVNFILQKQGEPAAALLPQWLSGTAFLFSTSADPAGARALAAQIKPSAGLVLGYDSEGGVDQAIAERIVVNAREAGLSIASHAAGAPSNRSAFDARLVRLRFASPEPRAALEAMLEKLPPQIAEDIQPLTNPASADAIYEFERDVLNRFEVVPIAYLPRIYGVGSRVRNWQVRGDQALDGWQLGDVWVEGEGP